MKRYRLRFKIILAISALLFVAYRPAVAAAPEVKKGPPADWVERLDVKPVSDLPVDEIQDGQYYLLVDKQFRVADDAPTQYYRHFAVQVVNAAGMEPSSQISIVFDPTYQVLRFHRLVIQRQEKIIDKLEQTAIQLLRREEELDAYIYDGRYTADLIVDDIRVGDVIEYAYTITGANPIYNNIFAYAVDTNWSDPVHKNHFRLLWPKARRLYQKSHNTDLALSPQDHDDYTAYSFIQENVKPVRGNSETPDWYQRYGYIQLSETSSWADVVAWAQPFYHPAYQADNGIKAVADRLVQPAASDEDKVIHALTYVQNEIRYLGIEFGVNSHKPSAPQDTLQRRYGDCKDKTVALIALLTAMGVETYPVLVHTRHQHAIENLHPTIHAFNHVIARATLNAKHYWLDPTRKYQGQNLQKVFQPDYGMALVLAPGTTALTKMPSNDHLVGTRIEETFDLRKDFRKAVPYSLTSSFQGLNAEGVRRTHAEEGRRTIEKKYLNYYAKYYDKIRLADPIDIIDSPENNELRLQENYHIDDFWEDNDGEEQWDCSFYTNAIQTYLGKPKQRLRHEPFRISHPVDVRQTIQILLPEPWDIQAYDFTEATAHFKFTSKISYDSDTHTITLDYHYRSFKDAVWPDELSSYLAALDRVDSECDYYLSQPYVSGSPSSHRAALDWIVTNPLVVGMVILAAAIVYCLVEWRIDVRRHAPDAAGTYYPVSLTKLFALSLATLGLYQLFWFYRNWEYIKQRDDSAIMPFWRAIFTPIWFYAFYKDLKRDSEQRFGQSLLPQAPWIVLLLTILIAASAILQIDEPYGLLGLLGVLGLLPFANYILYINRRQPQVIRQHSTIRMRHYLLGCLAATLVVFNLGIHLNWIPSGAVIKGYQLPRWDKKFMQRLGLLQRDAQLLYFYSDALIFTRHDGNGVSDRNVFSYWYDSESDKVLVKFADFKDIDDISVNYAESDDDNTVITIKPKSGSTFILYASGEKGRDRLFVQAIEDRLTAGAQNYSASTRQRSDDEN